MARSRIFENRTGYLLFAAGNGGGRWRLRGCKKLHISRLRSKGLNDRTDWTVVRVERVREEQIERAG